MSKEKLRKDKTCLNCNHEVTQRFCPNCSQENTETSKSFHHLFLQFFEVLTHYDSTFWKTIFYLFFKPAALTTAYVSGKRLSFLPPIRLYIFISFITFLSISLFPITSEGKIEPKKDQILIPSIDSLKIKEKGVDGLTKVGILSLKNNDTIKKILEKTDEIDVNEVADFGYKSVKELNLTQKNGKEKVKVSSTEYWFLKKWLTVQEENTNEEIIQKFSESFTSNLPKVLFMYMPIFGLILWFFHDKKKWLYFDNGIFTLHYFSFLLLVILLLFFINKLFLFFDDRTPILEWIHFSIKTVGTFWMIYYFFPAHYRFYGEKMMVSILKSGLILILNLVIITILLILFALYTYINIH